MKIISATFVGLIVCFLTTILLELAGHSLFPVPFKVDFTNMEAFNANRHLIPTGAYICVMIAHVVSLVLGLITAHNIVNTTMIPLYIIAGFMLFGTVTNVLTIPHPLWFEILEITVVTAVSILMLFIYYKRIVKFTNE
jgi:hypothetical protein